ncbi:hypothetical protein BDZ89DRAFT_54592 [Hymenopellis radicata]|nr:hypothetical protein BDZ89DRAFT_54592 [Hymenopellis radicata]
MKVMISLTLENNGSVARDHLASERTFLAYIRTSLVLASTGVALVQLFSISSHTTSDNATSFAPTSSLVHKYSRPLGATTVLLALLFLIIGVTRYFSIQQKLTEGVFPVARLFVVLLAVILAVLIAVVFAIVVARR